MHALFYEDSSALNGNSVFRALDSEPSIPIPESTHIIHARSDECLQSSQSMTTHKESSEKKKFPITTDGMYICGI